MTNEPNDAIREAVTQAIRAVDATIEDPEIIADEIIAAYKRALADAGLVIVPRKLTEPMINAAYDTDDLIFERGDGSKWIRWEDLPTAWQAMVAAAIRNLKDET